MSEEYKKNRYTLCIILKVDRYSYVMHLVSRVVGQLADNLDALHAYQSFMNMGYIDRSSKDKCS